MNKKLWGFSKMSFIPFIGEYLLSHNYNNLKIYLFNFYKFILDIGANLTDPMYKGIYNGNKKHEEDLDDVLKRSWENNLKRIIITSGNLDDSIEALKIASLSGILFNLK